MATLEIYPEFIEHGIEQVITKDIHKTAEMQNKSVTIPYNNQAGETHRLTLTFSLESAINNPSTETLANIKSKSTKLIIHKIE